ncbi:unnamed protein product [Symbiodinium sp. CCMP2456]|nr:unnamed protein product [Symbiodinium sp. CCMP2456]
MCRCGAIGQQLLLLSLVVAAPLCCGCDHEMVLVGGYGKCGTSHLNSILASHPRIVSLTKDGVAQMPWLEWSEMLLHLRRVACSAHGQKKAMLLETKKFLLAGEVRSEAVLVHTAKIPQQPSFQVLGRQVKVIKLLRDWLWAAYNYFSTEADASHPGSHTEMEFHYRSPEHFHEIVLSGGKLRGLNKYVETSAGDLRSLAEQLGPRFLVMKSEDLSKWSFLAKLAAFVNVPVSGFDAQLATMRTNSQFRAELRGGTTVSNVTETHGLYEISGFRPMQCVSRKLLYTRYREVCQAWQTDFNLTYKACLSDALECPGEGEGKRPALFLSGLVTGPAQQHL